MSESNPTDEMQDAYDLAAAMREDDFSRHVEVTSRASVLVVDVDADDVFSYCDENARRKFVVASIEYDTYEVIWADPADLSPRA